MSKHLLEAWDPTTTLGGTFTQHFDLHSDGTAAGDQAVGAIRAVCEPDYEALKAVFKQGDPPAVLQPGTVSTQAFVIHVDPSARGAYHYSCDGTEIWLLPQDAPALLVAEVSEVFMAHSNGWDCGLTNGEGLSRALAIDLRGFHVLQGLDGDVQGWWNGGHPADYVNDNSLTDQDQQGNACGTLFCFYLRYQLGYSWQQICTNGAATLALTYAMLTGNPGGKGFSDFVATLQQIDQGGQLQVPASGNPFPIGSPVPPPSPPPSAPPPPVPPPDTEPAWWEQLEQFDPALAEWLENLVGVNT